MIQIKRFLHHSDLPIPLLILLPLLLALLPDGLTNTADGPVHFIRSAEMVHAWQDGVWIPRWSANLGNGYGLPLFVYAPPLPYFSTALLHLLGLSLEVAFKGTVLIASLSATFGAYFLHRSLLGRLPAAVGAAAYLYAPIMLREFFIQGNVAQLLAWTFAPWACWGIIQLWQTHRLRYGLVITFAVMGTMLSHNAVALLLAGTIGSMSVILLLCTRDWRALLGTGVSSLLGLALSAWFWWPALREGDYVHLSRIVASDFRPRFISLTELIALSPRLDTGAINPYFPLTLGTAQVGMALLGVLLLLVGIGWYSRKPDVGKRLDRLTVACGLFFVLFTFFCALMATRWSEPIWNVLPFVNLFEWPFRWHGFTALGLSWLCAFAVFAAGHYWPRLHPWVGALALCLLIGSALVNLYPAKLPLGTFQATPADIIRFELHTNQIGTTSLGEFDPIWSNALASLAAPDDYRQQRPVNRLPRRLPTGAHGGLEATHVQMHQFRLTLPAPMSLTLELLYFPGWEATVDGAPVPIRPHPANGLIDLSIPAGEHTVRLVFRETPLRWWADLVSLVAWLGLLFYLAGRAIWSLFQRKAAQIPKATGWEEQEKWAVTTGANQQAFTTVALSVMLLSGVYLVLPDWFQVHSPPNQALPAVTKLQIDFADKLRLLGIDPAPSVVTAGDTLTVVTYWRALSRLTSNYGLFLHLDDASGQTIATVDQTHPSNIPTSSWAPSLYVRAPLRLTIPAAARPIRYRLRVGVVDPTNKAWLAPLHSQADGLEADVLEIGQVWVEPATVERPPTGPRAHFGESIQLLGLRYDPTTQTAILQWQTDRPIAQDYTIFVHALAANGALLGQIDGTPYQNLYSTSAWRPQQVIEDQRLLAQALKQPEPISRLAIGLYNPTSGERLAATGEDGQPLPDNALVVDVAMLLTK